MQRIFILLFLISSSLTAQKKITLEDIWTNRTFSTQSVRGLNFLQNGTNYTRLEGQSINEYNIVSGQLVGEIFNAANYAGVESFDGRISNYSFSEDESKILIASDSEQIYRRSSRAHFYLFDRANGKLSKINGEEKVMNAHLNPQGNKIAMVQNNDLYIKDLNNNEWTRVTQDGKVNEIINGIADWVYEEEFSIVRMFEWNETGNKLAFIRFDESEVKEFTMTKYNDDLYPEYVMFKYPKVGEKNSKVSLHLFNLNTNKTLKADLGDLNDMYLPRLKWTKDSNSLCVYKMNRHQNHLQLLLVNAENGISKVMMEEKNKYYVDIQEDIEFLPDGKHFIWMSEASGYNHIYLYDLKGQLVKQLTQGDYDVTNYYGFDPEKKAIYFQAAATSPLQKEIYVAHLDKSGKSMVSHSGGTNNGQFSGNFDYFVQTSSTINSPSVYTVMNKEGKEIRTILDNSHVSDLQKEFETVDVEFFDFKNSEDVELNGWTMKPADFNPTRKYPVFMYVYGGPGSQQVTDSWKGSNYWWFQMLTQQGYIVACVDNRGTGNRGEEFKKMTYLELGKYETIDQIQAAQYLGSLDYVDSNRIGIFGWSYGGYMSSLCILKGNDIFKAAIAVAPVTNWKWYDTIYTERYMRTEQENLYGYRDNSPVYFADRLKGHYLLVHGVADDNVHFQHTAEMANALIRENKQFDTYFYPNRAHGIFRDNARIHLYTKMTNFILENL